MVSEQDYPRQQMVWSDWCGWYIPASASARHPWPSRLIASSSSSLSGYGGGPYRQEMGVIGLGSSACKIPSRFQSESALEPYLPRQIPDSSDLRRRRGPAELALAVSGPAGGGSDRGGVKVPGSTPAKIPNPSFDLGNMTKSMVRYEAVATDPTAVWRIASASNWRPSEEPKDLPDLVPSAEWENEKARRSVELRRITPMSTQGKQGMGAPEGNFNPPSTGCSAVPSGWSQNQLPPACPVFPNLNNFNPSHGPELARQCPQYPREIRNQCPFQYQAIQWNRNSGNGSEKDALSAMGKNADSNEVDEIQKDEPALKGSDAKTKSNDPTEAPSQPVETNVKTEEMGDRPGKDWVVVRGPEEDNSKMFEAEGDEAKKENAEEKKGVNELGEEDKINKDDVVKTIVQHNLINYLIEGDEIESALKALGLNGSTIQGAHLPFTNSSNVVGHVVEKSFDRQDRGFRGTRLLWTLPPWPGFCTMNCDRFAQHCEYEVIEKFYSVKLYNHSFLYYIDRFEELIKIWPIMNEDYYARVEGREIISNLSKVTGHATMSAALRLGLDNIDENVRNTIAWAFSVMASALDTSALLSFLKTICQSKKSWQVRHTDIKVVQQTAILMGCTDLPHLKSLVEISEHGLSDENPKVQTITALVEAVAPYGIESFNTVWKPPWKGNRSHLGKVLAAYLINEKLSIDEIKLTPLKLIELIASIKTGTIRGKIGMEKEGFTTIVSIFRSVKCSEEVVDLIKTKTLHAIYDLGILIAKRLCQDHIKVSETQMVPLPTQLDAQVQNDQYENSVESDEQMRPWSENYFDPTTKNWTIQHTGSATCKRGFVQFCYEPIKQIIKTCMNDQKDKLWPMLQKLGMNLENFEPQMLDSYKRVTVSKNDTVILDRAEDKKSIEERAYQARSAIEQSTSDYDKEKLQERLAKLSGGVTVLNIGGASEAEMMGEVGTKHMSYLPDMIPFLRGLPNDETPAVARQAVKTGTNLFATVLEQLVIQGLFLSEGIVDSLNISWEWLLKLKSVVSLMASQHSSNEGVRLLVVKFVEKAVLMYTPDPNISSDPPSEVTEDMGFNVAWLRGGHPLLNVGDLAMDASQSWGLWLEQLKSLKEKSLSTSMIIVFVGSLSAIDQRRHSFYGSILPVLLSLDPASSIIKVQVPGAFYALKSAFIAFLKCTHSSAEPCRAHLWEAQNIINQGDSIEHTVNAARSFGDTSNRAESLLLTEASTDNSNKRSLDEDRNNMLEDDGHSSKRVIQSHDAPEHSAKAKKRNVESASIDVSSSQAALARTGKFEAVDKVIVPDFLIKILEDKYYLEGEGMSEPGNT